MLTGIYNKMWGVKIMSSARLSFVKRLEEKMMSDPEARLECIESSHRQIKRGLTNRAFDSRAFLPLNLDDLNDLTTEFNVLLNTIKLKTLELDNLADLLLDSDKKKFSAWLNKIHVIARREILDGQEVKKELLSLLEWNKLDLVTTKFTPDSVVNACICASCQQIMEPLAKEICNDSNKSLIYNALISYMNNQPHEIAYLPEIILNNPGKTSLLLTGIAVATVAAVSLFRTLYGITNGNGSKNEPDEPKKPVYHL